MHSHEFSGGSAEAVLDSLAAYQFDDGGYGRSLEPDAVLDASSVLDTTCALQVHRRLSVPADHPQVSAALEYLRRKQDAATGLWLIRPIVPPDSICAPWWKGQDRGEELAGGKLNPRAEILGYLIDYGNDGDRERIDSVSRQLVSEVAGGTESLQMHGLLCVARLTRARKLDDDWRVRLIERVQRDVPSCVERDPEKWDGYGLKPWWITERPDDPLLGGLEPGLVDAMLDHEIGRQEADGGWPPFWDWGGLHPEAWSEARLAWKSILTEQMLRVLRNFGRLEV